MDEDDRILYRITAMATEERELRQTLGADRFGAPEQRRRLGEIERELDQCWDLLRQRRAKAEFGMDPDEAHARSSSQVESYQS
jgi:hypothetical protein